MNFVDLAKRAARLNIIDGYGCRRPIVYGAADEHQWERGYQPRRRCEGPIAGQSRRSSARSERHDTERIQRLSWVEPWVEAFGSVRLSSLE